MPRRVREPEPRLAALVFSVGGRGFGDGILGFLARLHALKFDLVVLFGRVLDEKTAQALERVLRQIADVSVGVSRLSHAGHAWRARHDAVVFYAVFLETDNAENSRFHETAAKVGSSLRKTTSIGSNSELRFRFRGKSGRFHESAVSDKKLAAIVRRCAEFPGHELFQLRGR